MSKAITQFERTTEPEDREMPHGRPAPGRRCIYCNEIIMGFSCPDRRFCSETCILAHSEAHKRGFYAAECTRCARPREEHESKQKRGALYTDYLCSDGRPAEFTDMVGRAKPLQGAEGKAANYVEPFFSDSEREEMYRGSQAILEDGEERWTREEHEDERNADEY